MKNWIRKFSIKQIVLVSITVVSLLLFLVLTVVSQQIKTSMTDQQAAERWAGDEAYAQVSCFFSESEEIDHYQILSFRNQINTGLKEASLEVAEGNARPYIDSYSSQGKIVINSGKSNWETDAIGIGGDFFRFHPVKLLNGSYFSEDNLMQDYIIIDENAAWKLFGSNDVVGMQVTIGNVPHYIAGVIRKAEGRMWESAGLGESIVYVSSETLAAYGTTTGIHQYEVVMPNPVSGFAYRLVKEKFGFDEYKMEVVDNTHRYDIEPMVRVILDFGLRSMQHYAIQYPYWENYARGYEDILAFLLIFQILFLLIAIMIMVAALIQGYRHRTWTWKDIGHGFVNFIVYLRKRFKERVKSEKHRWEHF